MGHLIVILVPTLIGDGVVVCDDLRLVGDVIGPELDAMLDATGLDECHPRRVVVDAVFVLSLAIEHVAHGENGLERIALRAAGRTTRKPRGWRPGWRSRGST